MNDPDWQNTSFAIIGIDLAWGDRNPDGVTRLLFPDGVQSDRFAIDIRLSRGDEALLSLVDYPHRPDHILLAIDAPTIGPNESGSRPVDRECTSRFGKFEAGCHPVNRALCQRPFRIAERLESEGFRLDSDLGRSSRLAAEVYPHPAMIRWFGLDRTIKYKRGPVAERRKEFARYQGHVREFLSREFSGLSSAPAVQEVLTLSWTKQQEDQLDSFVCALIGWWHVRFAGSRSEILGDTVTGQILLPSATNRREP